MDLKQQNTILKLTKYPRIKQIIKEKKMQSAPNFQGVVRDMGYQTLNPKLERDAGPVIPREWEQTSWLFFWS